MSAEADFLKPVAEQALRESELVAVRTLSGHVETLGTQIESLRVDMREVRDKVITFEAAKMEAQISGVRAEHQALAIKVATLELQRATTVGAKSLATEFREWLPALVMLGGALLFWFKNS